MGQPHMDRRTTKTVVEDFIAKMEAEELQEEFRRRFVQMVSLCQPGQLRIEWLFWPAGMTRN
jgi:hypothetical protein